MNEARDEMVEGCAKPIDEIEPVLIDEKDACALLSCAPRTLYDYRTKHGLPYVSFVHKVLYRPDALRSWAEGQEQVNEIKAAS